MMKQDLLREKPVRFQKLRDWISKSIVDALFSDDDLTYGIVSLDEPMLALTRLSGAMAAKPDENRAPGEKVPTHARETQTPQY